MIPPFRGVDREQRAGHKPSKTQQSVIENNSDGGLNHVVQRLAG
jgi:hypothetical protein